MISTAFLSGIHNHLLKEKNFIITLFKAVKIAGAEFRSKLKNLNYGLAVELRTEVRPAGVHELVGESDGLQGNW